MDIISVLGFSLAVIGGLLILVFLVVVHELGHAIVARRNGVVVEEFGIGFPPRAWAKKLKNGILLTLNWLPLGGFVKLKGEHDSDTQKGGYGSATLWAKTKILLAGVVVNWFVAVFIFTALAIIGLPKVVPNQFYVPADSGRIQTQPVTIEKIIEDSPAQAIGLQKGDVIKSLAGQQVTMPAELSLLTAKNAGSSVSITIIRGGQELTRQVKLNAVSSNSVYLGVSPAPQAPQYIHATWSAPIVGIGTTLQFTQLTFQGIGELLTNVGKGITAKFSGDEEVKQSGEAALNEAGQGVAGPIGILGNIFPSAIQAGVIPLLFLTAVISLTLAVMNVLPIPALDGGRLYVTLLFKAIKKPLTKEREEKIQAAGFLSLMALIIVVTVLDIGKFF